MHLSKCPRSKQMGACRTLTRALMSLGIRLAGEEGALWSSMPTRIASVPCSPSSLALSLHALTLMVLGMVSHPWLS
jgi:hypothetical protein